MSYFRVGLVNLIKSNKINYYKKKRKKQKYFPCLFIVHLKLNTIYLVPL